MPHQTPRQDSPDPAILRSLIPRLVDIVPQSALRPKMNKWTPPDAHYVAPTAVTRGIAPSARHEALCKPPLAQATVKACPLAKSVIRHPCHVAGKRNILGMLMSAPHRVPLSPQLSASGASCRNEVLHPWPPPSCCGEDPSRHGEVYRVEALPGALA